MSHHVTAAGGHYVECDEPVRGADGALSRCGRRSRTAPGPLTFWATDERCDLARGWSVAPYPDDFDHGATRTNLLDGSPIPPIPTLVGIRGDLHTCPACDRARVPA